MKIIVYKGFAKDFLNSVDEEPLVKGSIEKKKNVTHFDKKMRKQLSAALLELDEDEQK